MLLDPNPVYRRVIVVWYDSEGACLATLIFLLVVFIFSYCGIQTALEYPEYREYIWIPGLLTGLSMGVMVSITIRMINRYLKQIGR